MVPDFALHRCKFLMGSPASDTPALRTGEFVPLIALLISLGALAIDGMLPALPAIGSGALEVVTMALVRDQYEGRQMARLMSFATSLFILAPTIAPARCFPSTSARWRSSSPACRS